MCLRNISSSPGLFFLRKYLKDVYNNEIIAFSFKKSITLLYAFARTVQRVTDNFDRDDACSIAILII